MLVVRDGDGEIVVDGRTEALVRFIVARAAAINAPQKLRLEFNCAGRTARPRIELTYEDTEAPVLGIVL